MLSSVLTRREGLKEWLSPPRSGPAKEPPLLAPPGQGPQTLLSCHCWGSQAPRMTGPQAPRLPYGRELEGVEGGKFTKVSQPDGCSMRRQRWGWARVTTSSRPGLDKVLETSRTWSSTCNLGPPAHPLTKGYMSWRAMRKSRDPPLTQSPLAMITAPLTTDLMEPLTVDNRQLLTWERSPLPCGPMAEQDY